MEAIKRWLRRQLANPQVALLGVLLLVGLVVIYFFGGMLAPFLAAVVIAYLLDGIALRMQRLGLPRPAAVVTVFIGFLVGIVLLCFVLLPSIVSQVQSFVVDGSPKIIQTAKTAYDELQKSAKHWLTKFGENAGNGENAERPDNELAAAQGTPPGGKTSSLRSTYTGALTNSSGEKTPETKTADTYQSAAGQNNPEKGAGSSGSNQFDLGQQITTIGTAIGTTLLGAFRNVVVWIVYLVLIPVMVLFMLKDKEKIIAWLIQFLPKDRSLAAQVWHDVNIQTGNYIRGKFWEIIIVWSVTYVTFSLFGLKTALLLSFFVGLSVLVPYVGAAVMYIPITLAAFDHAAFDQSGNWNQKIFWEVFWILAAYTIIQILDGNVLAPILFSDVTSMHPVAIILAILIFGGLWGFWGVFFAIPLATLVHAVIKAWPKEFIQQPPEG